MEYNFDTPPDRHGTNSYKWDSSDDCAMLPLWVADMDFTTCPAVIEALRKRIEHGIYGYTHVGNDYYNAVISWFSRRHALDIRKEWIIYTSGVVPAISAIIKALTHPGDKVLVQTPVYNCFFSSIRNNGCKMVSNPLVKKDNTYQINYEDLEEKAADPSVKVMLLCNPHNPAGRVWTRDELLKIGNICLRHGVTVVSDEIHCELVFSPHIYTPFASICKGFLNNSITCVSPSKAFNLAGLQIANIIATNDIVRQKIDRAINDNEVCDVNPFGITATIAAYNEGEEWLNRLLEYIWGNYTYMKEYCSTYLPDFPIITLEGTYLAWMACSAMRIPSHQLEELLKEKAHIWLNAGTMYGNEGEGFMRWNLACTRKTLAEALERFTAYANSKPSLNP
mgnify:FL=1